MKSLIDMYKKKCLAPFIFSSLPEEYAIMRHEPKDVNANAVIYSILECKWYKVERIIASMGMDGYDIRKAVSCKIDYTNDYSIFVNLNDRLDEIESVAVTAKGKLMYFKGYFIDEIERPLIDILLKNTNPINLNTPVYIRGAE